MSWVTEKQNLPQTCILLAIFQKRSPQSAPDSRWWRKDAIKSLSYLDKTTWPLMKFWSLPPSVQEMWTIYFLVVKDRKHGLNGEHVLNGHLQRLSSGHSSLGFATFQALNPSFAQEDDEKYRFKAWNTSFFTRKRWMRKCTKAWPSSLV